MAEWTARLGRNSAGRSARTRKYRLNTGKRLVSSGSRGASEAYLVPDLLTNHLRLVFCGTAPSTASAQANAYYAKPGNKFWRTLHEVGLTPRQFQPSEYRKLLALNIGLTDLCKSHCGIDADLPKGAFDLPAFHRKMAQYQPQYIAFTSKNAAQIALGTAVVYGLQRMSIGESLLFVLPSPSGLAVRYFDRDIWHALACLVNRNIV